VTNKPSRFKEALDALTLLFAAVAAVAAGFAAYYSNGQLREMQKQTANAARSWVGFRLDDQTGLPFSIDNVEVSPRLSVTAHYTIENFGDGPAIKVIPTFFVVTEADKTTVDNTADFICDSSKRFSTGTVLAGPGVPNPGPLGYVLFPKQTYSHREPWGGDAQPSLKWLYVMGCTAYVDQFKASHWTRACVLVGDGKIPVNNYSPRQLCTLYNDTDETGDKDRQH
jgi:hypothetical protein